MKYKIIISGTDFDETAKGMGGWVYICLHIYIYKSKNYHEWKGLTERKWIKIIEFS